MITKTLVKTKNKYSIEYFHIYTDEIISDYHARSLQYLAEAQKAWQFDLNLIVLIDNYNPQVHTLTKDNVLEYLKGHNMTPDYIAFEGDLLINAKLLLESLTSPKLRSEYDKYIQRNNKYPCSLLTATFYLTRLGRLDYKDCIKGVFDAEFIPANKLINILPATYQPVEARAFQIIKNSRFAEEQHNIQNLFYDADVNRKIELF